MNEFDRAMNLLDEKFSILSSKKQIVSSTNEEDKVFIFWREAFIFKFMHAPCFFSILSNKLDVDKNMVLFWKWSLAFNFWKGILVNVLNCVFIAKVG